MTVLMSLVMHVGVPLPVKVIFGMTKLGSSTFHPRSEGFDMRMPKLLVGALALAFLFSTSAYAQKGRSSSSSRPSGGSSRPSSGGSMFGGSKPSTSSKPPSSATGGKTPYRCR